MKVSVEDFKALPIISGNLNLKWALYKLIPEIDFTELIHRLSITYQVRYNKSLKKVMRKNPDFDEAPIWQYLPKYKMMLHDDGLSIYLSSDIGASYGFLFRVDRQNRELYLLN
jgi:hypothetical protein